MRHTFLATKLWAMNFRCFGLEKKNDSIKMPEPVKSKRVICQKLQEINGVLRKKNESIQSKVTDISKTKNRDKCM